MARSRTKISGGMIADASITSDDLGASVARSGDVDFMALKIGIQNNLAIYNLKDGIVDRYADATGVDDSASTDETRDSSGKYYSGYELVSQPGNSTSGILTTHGSFAVNTFLSSSTFDAGTAGGTVDILLVGGGGSGGSGMAGGGGGGQVRTITSQAVAAGSHTVTVAPTTPVGGPPFAVGVNGGTTSFGSLPTAIGGGGGGTYSGFAGLDGASGGGGGGEEGNSPSATVPGGTGLAGNPGGTGTMRYGGSYGGQGGGGGAGGPGSNGTSNGPGGNGGVGLQNDYRTGSPVYYAGGGGGADYSDYAGGTGGAGGGGRGPTTGAGTDNTPGEDNTGGGGGGSYYPAANTQGGSGIVVVRYTANSLAFNAASYNDMTLISNAQTAVAAPTLGRILVLDEASTGTTTINTDVKAYISRDNGTTYSQVTLTDDGEYATGKRMLSGSVDISGQPSGTAMRYKIETLNQSATKVTRIYGTALLW